MVSFGVVAISRGNICTTRSVIRRNYCYCLPDSSPSVWWNVEECCCCCRCRACGRVQNADVFIIHIFFSFRRCRLSSFIYELSANTRYTIFEFLFFISVLIRNFKLDGMWMWSVFCYLHWYRISPRASSFNTKNNSIFHIFNSNTSIHGTPIFMCERAVLCIFRIWEENGISGDFLCAINK